VKNPTLRRVAIAAIAPVLAAGTVLAAPAAQAGPETDAAATWLAAQIGNVDEKPDLFTSFYEGSDGTPQSFLDYGVNLDLSTALATHGDAANAERVYDAVVAEADDYTDAYGSVSTGAIAKLATAKQANDDDAGALVTRLEGFAQTTNTGGKRGFISAGSSDYTNTITQSFGVRALSTAGSDRAKDAVAFILRQQCPDGSFRQDLSGSTCKKGSGSVDSTAFAIQALRVAAGNGITGLQDDIADAGYWLAGTQASNGSFDETSGANSNSTGLAAAALQASCHPGDARQAAQWVSGLQVTADQDPAEVGAIALSASGLSKVDPIKDVDRDQFVRASVQAILGLDALEEGGSLDVVRARQFVSAGTAATVTATGLETGQRYVASIPGGGAVEGVADASGKAKASVTTPATSGTRTVTLCSAEQPGKVGTTKVTVLAARKLSVALRYSSVKAGKSQNVKVKGLARGEAVKVYYRGKRIKVGVATDGTFSHTFKVGNSKGTKTVRVNGEFTNRTSSKTFTVR
jgi:hypothetical protein